MHVGILTSSFPAHPRDARAAAGLFVRDFAVVLAQKSCDVTVFTPDKDENPKETPQGINVCWFPWLGGRKRLSYMNPLNPVDAVCMVSLFVNGRKHLARLHREHPFDALIAMWAVPSGLLGCFLKRTAGVPLITWCLGSDIWSYGRYPILRRVVAGVLRNSDCVYADGNDLARAAAKLSGVACTFLPSSRLIPRRSPHRSAAGSGTFRFLFVGRYARVKGVDVLVEAARKLRDQGVDFHLQMLGGGPLGAEIRRRVDEYGLSSVCSIGGYADLDTVLSHLDTCNVLVIPSRMESIPLVFSDALQAGRPVIVTHVGDMGALVREHNAGHVVAPGDPEALAAAMMQCIREGTGRFMPGVKALAGRFDLHRAADIVLGQIELLQRRPHE